ncbi:esterase-like activity of phytase family protein [Stakelama sp. CBK3Z-3]|uniref:Esterase-like activity of phytase family protein n=1 Tax=Stakelama flava TaxID=2860338 RepID=A0ABS6XL91_9SPHN|nr:esterase-like activity of phytase family protein [Stakelama flava]MBW4330972.1 esterase-like activity of phytase family protein [Stakelama flava]
MRIFFAVLLLLLLLPGYSGMPGPSRYEPDMRVSARPVALFPGSPERRTIGALRYLGGVVLESPDPAFGGYSSMRLRDGRFTMLSDTGNWIAFRLSGARVSDLTSGSLPGGPGTGWQKRDRDSESLAAGPGAGPLWVGFENSNAIWRYNSLGGKATGHVRPDAMKHWPMGGGPESLVRLSDGRFITISETGHWPKAKGRAAICFSGDPVESPGRGFRFAYRPPAGYDPSDMAQLPDGRLLVLNRRLSLHGGFSAKLTLIDLDRVQPGRMVSGSVIATLAKPALHDNFEALAVTHEKGRIVVWIASDDNQSLFEKTYLLKFALQMPPR